MASAASSSGTKQGDHKPPWPQPSDVSLAEIGGRLVYHQSGKL